MKVWIKMNSPTIAPKLKKNDCVRVISPAFSLAIISDETRKIANKNFGDLDLMVSFGKNSTKVKDFTSSAINDRLEDFHNAFGDKKIKAVFSTIGGYNSNQLLDDINWEFLKRNPKIICGYSDITVLLNAIYHKIGLVTYYGPHYSTLGQKKELEYTLDYLRKCLIEDGRYIVYASDSWTDDQWWIDQDNRNFQKNEGWIIVNTGSEEGIALGGNISSLGLLKGTEYMPDLTNGILFLEEEGSFDIKSFDRELYSLLQQKGGRNIKGILVGRFQRSSDITIGQLIKVFEGIKRLKNIPIIINMDFGHTNPMFTFPIGGRVKINAGNKPNLELLSH